MAKKQPAPKPMPSPDTCGPLMPPSVKPAYDALTKPDRPVVAPADPFDQHGRRLPSANPRTS